MTGLEHTDVDRLHEWLEAVEGKEATMALTAAVAVDRGETVESIADWQGREPEAVRADLDAIDSPSLVSAIAVLEGVDIDGIAELSSLSSDTVRDWFDSLSDRPVPEAADVISRYAGSAARPLVTNEPSTVYHLSYDVLRERDWSIEDPDLFEKAAAADLELPEFGRFLVQPDESILEAAERGGRDWPYACRAGACSNCAVIVVDGDVAMPSQSILSDDQIRTANARLSCVGVPVTEEVSIVTGVGDLADFADLRLPSPTDA
ncbi:ferredoxin Fer [Halorubrum vacuolatum]|uniref:Ferredoxin n=1 Tax=Halorubrum vacuolatum TaxID=63740 RepID=A0A238VMX9_HALVU|nr:ferredoxin Fer [Halorubrum vacuolatum]SNR35093.1 Ferredoxin [Halorubrum vacuolatum]